MSDPKKFVAGLELRMPEHPLQSTGKPRSRELALEGSEEEKAAAFISDKSLVAFVSAVSGQNRQDVLNSTLLAQLAANKKFPEDKDMIEWFQAYTAVLRKLGWNVQGKDFSVVNTDTNLFEMETVVLDIIGASVTGNALIIITKTIEAFRKLSNTDNRVVVFEKNTHSMQKGGFQLALADETDGLVSLTMVGFIVSSTNEITRILFFKSSQAATELRVSSLTATLNPEVYSLVRKDILNKLGDTIHQTIADLEI